MTPTMVISCPDCGTKIRVPESSIGKKIRCKACEQVFAVQPPNKPSEAITKPEATGKPPAKKATPPAAKKAAPVPAKKGGPAPPKKAEAEAPFKLAGDEPEVNDDDGKAYGLGETDETYRCPQCAAEMDGPEAVLCLNCGFHTQTRVLSEKRRIKDLTGEDKFWWLLPGILCGVGVVLLITYWCIHYFVIPSGIWDEWDSLVAEKGRNKAIADESITGWYQMFFHPAFTGLLALLFLWIGWKLGRFSFERLVLHPTPPELEIKD